MKSFHIPRTALFFILFALAAFAVLYLSLIHISEPTRH